VSDFDPAPLRAAAEGLQSMSDDLRQATLAAQEQTFRASDDDGLAEVRVDGRPRIIDLHLHAEALRRDPDELDRLLTGLINQALTEARTATQSAIFAALPPSVRRDLEEEQP
jgi:DNA-binding protein YbaB